MKELELTVPNPVPIIYATTLKFLLLIECNLIRLGGHAHGIVTKTVHKTLPGGGGGPGGWVGRG